MAETADKATNASLSQKILSFIPILTWIRQYEVKSFLRPDVLAGLTVAAFVVPEAMAYAGLAGLTPEHGLYACLAALLVYAIFGTSRELNVSVTSALSIMVAGTLGAMVFAGPDEYLAAAQLTAIFAGIFALIAGVLRLGFIVNFVSESVLVGFSAGAALYIGSSQLSKLFGIEGVQGNFFERMNNVIKNLDETNGWTLGLGIACLLLLLIAEQRFPHFPSGIAVVAIAIILMYVTNLEDRGVSVAGHIPRGLPTPTIPTVPSDQIPQLIGLAAGCFLLSYVEGIGVARTFAAKHKEKIDANQELVANGAANVAAGVFQGYPVGGSMSSSAVKDSAGAKTPLAGAFAALLLAVVLVALTGPFSKLPETTLAAIVLVAVRGLIDVPALRRLARLSREEFAAAMLTMGGVLVFGMLQGILIGAIFSVLALIYRVSNPRVIPIGRVPGTTLYTDSERHPENQQTPGALVFRVDGDIFYANSNQVSEEILRQTPAEQKDVKLVVLDLVNTPTLDLAAIDMIDEVGQELAERNIELRLAEATGSVRDELRRAGLSKHLSDLNELTTVDRVLEDWTHRGTSQASGEPVVRTS